VDRGRTGDLVPAVWPTRAWSWTASIAPRRRAARVRGLPARSRPEPVEWESRWIRWPDFWLPLDRGLAEEILRLAWRRAADERVEIACGGGHGRTGTALACLAVLDGVAPGEAVAYVREGYHRQAVETPWQYRYVTRLEP